jgi:hypothetical protein
LCRQGVYTRATHKCPNEQEAEQATKSNALVRQASAPLLLTQNEVNQFELHMDLSGYRRPTDYSQRS